MLVHWKKPLVEWPRLSSSFYYPFHIFSTGMFQAFGPILNNAVVFFYILLRLITNR